LSKIGGAIAVQKPFNKSNEHIEMLCGAKDRKFQTVAHAGNYAF
jgi:hypothetical protein